MNSFTTKLHTVVDEYVLLKAVTNGLNEVETVRSDNLRKAKLFEGKHKACAISCVKIC